MPSFAQLTLEKDSNIFNLLGVTFPTIRFSLCQWSVRKTDGEKSFDSIECEYDAVREKDQAIFPQSMLVFVESSSPCFSWVRVFIVL